MMWFGNAEAEMTTTLFRSRLNRLCLKIKQFDKAGNVTRQERKHAGVVHDEQLQHYREEVEILTTRYTAAGSFDPVPPSTLEKIV
ncbi:hypothetical protein DICVIV_07349 [Dictyocaulus viviparus]|uniref:Uncharacterized protein n=1 Tax=Dictyocaulus viviparus TaxID=29172 RepID=A0A0D8XS67_DICVI|nr:hypothetical protein DICVIV_07349 [Dictyocaulus viviparus]